MRCFDERELRQFLQGLLPVDEMMAAGEHIHACDACRASIKKLSVYRKAALSVLDGTLGSGECPDYEELSAYIEETLSHEAHQKIERHISICELCWRDVETLQAVRSRALLAPEITVTPGQFTNRISLRRTIFGWHKAAALSAGAAAVALALVLSNPTPVVKSPGDVKTASVPKKPSVVAVNPERPQTGKIAGSVNVKKQSLDSSKTVIATKTLSQDQEKDKNIKPVEPVPSPRQKLFVAELEDGGITVGSVDGSLAVRSNGRDMEAQLAAIVKQNLKEGKVQPSFQMARADVLRTPAGPREITRLISPPPDGTADSRPLFSWEPVEGATKYRIEVYELDGTPVLTSETEDTAFQPDDPLQAGWYKWVVRPKRGITADWEWSKAVAVRILSQKEEALLARAKQDYPDSHIVAGSVYESLGLAKDAVREFEELVKKHPKSQIANKLLDGAKSQLPQ